MDTFIYQLIMLFCVIMLALNVNRLLWLKHDIPDEELPTTVSIIQQLTSIEYELNMVRREDTNWTIQELDGTLIHLDQLRNDLEHNMDSYQGIYPQLERR